jgi:hypothetical protein
MNKTNSKEATIQPAYTKEEIIIILQKAFNDYNMVDSKMKEILKSGSSAIESKTDVNRKFIEANNVLIECARIRNNMLEELLITIVK